MKISAWRILHAKYSRDAFSGEGAFKYGGRWNSTSVRVVYTAQSIALATLEILAGGAPMSMLGDFVKIPVDFDDSSVHSLVKLPEHWNAYPPSRKTKEIGDTWVKESKSVVLKVPSAIIREEFIYIINPLHQNAHKSLHIGTTQKFHVDTRIKSI
jgi:RES domain-containing protein